MVFWPGFAYYWELNHPHNFNDMPIIEITSINSFALNLRQEDFDVAIIEDHKHKSCRWQFGNDEKGTIIHIGDPNLIEHKYNMCIASEIIDWEFEPVDIIYYPEIDDHCNGGENQLYKFKFLKQYKKDIDKLLRSALQNSPVKKGHFLSDYQFGPSIQQIRKISKISDLWSLHDREGLIFNTLYQLSSS